MAKYEHPHITDIWGYYCESYCRACEKNQKFCSRCESYYGVYQWHDCDKALEELKAKQLEFDFK